MRGRDRLARAGEAGASIVQRRVAGIAGRAAGVVGGIFALGVCAIVGLVGNGPGPLLLLAIVLGAALACYLLVRTVVLRIDAAGVAAALARRAQRRRRP